MHRSNSSLLRCLGLIWAISLAGQPSAAELAPTKLKGLLITGGCCHDYERQKVILTEGLSQRVSIAWDIVHEGDPNDRTYKISVYNNPHWTRGYDVIVHSECFGSVEDVRFVEQIVRGHTETGVPAIVLHCSMHTYRAAATDEWRKLLGVTSRRHEKGGRALEVKPAEKGKDHPIMTGFPASWTTPGDELYVIENLWPNCTPLALAYGEDTKQNHPVIWTNTYGKARVFGTTLGHNNLTMGADTWLDCVARGLLWSLGKLNADGSPAPGFAGTGKRPFSFELAQAAGAPTEASWAKSIKFPATEKSAELFNGRDFDGWEGHTGKYFTIQDGVIVAKNSAENAPKVSTYLLTKKPYRNFRLVFEGRLVQSQMHSGISIWGRKYETGDETTSYQGHLVMFPTNWGFWDLYRRNSIYQDDGRARKADNVGGWNRMEILAIGSRIRLAVNGQEAADWTDPKPELCGEGPIGLQLHSNTVPQEVHFRGLILSENPEDRLITVEKK